MRWRGDVRVEREGADLFVTLNAAHQRKRILALRVVELLERGIRASAAEL